MALVGDRRLQLAFVWAFGFELAIQGSAPDWWGGHAFGPRRFLDLVPFWCLGLAALAQRLRPWAAGLAAAALSAWNLLLVANFEYVIRVDRDPGYWGLLRGQMAALSDLPRLAVQGGVVRDLVLWPLLHRPPGVGAGLALLALEALALGAGVMCAGQRESEAKRGSIESV
jgi:hypothetical protein